jgi:hypothetical protein
MIYYTYYSYEEFGRGYIGAKPSGSIDPENDGYFGSFSDQSFNPTNKIILGEYSTPAECMEAEVILHEFFQVDKNPHFANRAKQTATGFLWLKGQTAKYTKEELKIRRKLQRQEKARHQSKVWINNGVIETQVNPNNIPEGWKLGRLNYISPVVKSGLENTSYGKKWFNNGNEERFALPEEVDSFWEVGRLRHSCPHCGKSTSAGMLKRWHLDNCKFKING